jgi:glutamate dehydrogenase
MELHLNSPLQNDYLNKVLNSLHLKDPHFKTLAEGYLRKMFASDVARIKPADLKTLLKENWKIVSEWDSKSPKINIQSSFWATQKLARGTFVHVLFRNMPFASDAICTELRRKGYDLRFVSKCSMQVERQKNIIHTLQFTHQEEHNEQLLVLELSQSLNQEEVLSVQKIILSIIQDISYAVEDYDTMRQSVLMESEGKEDLQFLEKNFIFWGISTVDTKGATTEKPLGVFRGDINALLKNIVAQEIQRPLENWSLSKLFCRTVLDRHEPLDIISIQKSDGSRLICIGTLSYSARSLSYEKNPLVDKKIQIVLNALNESVLSLFEQNEIRTLLDYIPLYEVINYSVDQLVQLYRDVFMTQARETSHTYYRYDSFSKQLVCMIFVSPDKLTNKAHALVIKNISKYVNGVILHSEVIASSSDWSILYTYITLSEIPSKIEGISQIVTESLYSWSEYFTQALSKVAPDREDLIEKWSNVFSEEYSELNHPDQAAQDVIILDQLEKSQTNTDVFVKEATKASVEKGKALSVRIYKKNKQITLFELYPILDHMGLRLISERECVVGTVEETSFWIYEVRTECVNTVDSTVFTPLTKLLKKVLAGDAGSDDLNALVLSHGADYRHILLIKAFLAYLKQIQFPFGGKYSRSLLLKNSDILMLLVSLFETKFDPKLVEDARKAKLDEHLLVLESKLLAVVSIDESKLFHHLLNLIESIVRTNYFMLNDNGCKPYISLKIQSPNIIDIPLPTPKVEIFVYGRDFEGVHLRSGNVSRGGIRWSDRREDFRTEILALVKAQNTKNAIIIPMGSKGGFYVKNESASYQDGVECYRNFIRGLLDITDNLVDGRIVPPQNVVRYDDDDPYLVVAADKGTATFSDIANSISNEYGFWLQDAFASGGGNGYDHKKMGITSRGAWESAKAHCREVLGVDPEKEAITMVGVGDMSGDVFGNGLLRSRSTLLKAAFNHAHIFIDPTPDAEQSYVERFRLFNLPRSTWEDYNASLLSKGGMIVSRTVHSVDLTPEAQELLGFSSSHVTTVDVIRAILKLSVDMIWFGGIGTYVKSSQETNAEAKDHANDAVRVDAKDMRAKIIVEGANLGVTQKARIEYSLLTEGRINTDFIDNSGGVSCSDHEVNLKILLNELVNKKHMSLEQRNELLQSMTEEVGNLVIKSNVLQNMILSYAEKESIELLDVYEDVMFFLQQHANLNPSIEFLPSDSDLTERRRLKQGLTRPELSVLLSYMKNYLQKELVVLDSLETPITDEFFVRYFPEAVQKYQKEPHRLRRDIIATELANEMIDRFGICFIHKLMHQTGRSLEEVVRAYLSLRNFFDLSSIWKIFDIQLNTLSLEGRVDFVRSSTEVVYQACVWVLMNGRPLPHSDTFIAESNQILESVKKHQLELTFSDTCVVRELNELHEFKQIVNEMQQKLTVLYIWLYNDICVSDVSIGKLKQHFTYVESSLRFNDCRRLLELYNVNSFADRLFIEAMGFELNYLKGNFAHVLNVAESSDHAITLCEDSSKWILHMINNALASSTIEASNLVLIMRHWASVLRSLRTRFKGFV